MEGIIQADRRMNSGISAFNEARDKANKSEYVAWGRCDNCNTDLIVTCRKRMRKEVVISKFDCPNCGCQL